MAMLMSRNNQKPQMKKLPAKRPWTDVQSKPLAISVTANRKKLADLSADPGRVVSKLKKHYPDAHCALDHKNAFELLIATVLSAQCTDVRVNKVTPALFKKYPTPKAMAAAPIESIEQLIQSTGFFRNKAKNIKSASADIVGKHGNEVPKTMEDLSSLAGVGRKTANVVLGNAFGLATGVVVDTHVGRLSYRLGWTKSENPIIIERDLIKLFPESEWILLSHLLISLGRDLCRARNPRCSECFLFDACPRRGVK